MNILFIGPYRQDDGWGDASLSTIKALLTTQHNLTLRPIFMGNRVKQKLPDEVVYQEYTTYPSYDIVIQHVLPHLADYNGCFAKNIIKSHLETSDIHHLSWPHRFVNMDEVWINSNTEHYTLVEAGVSADAIQILPQSFDDNIFTREYKPFEEDVLKDKFIFYFIGEWSTRKGIVDLLIAYLSEFTINDDVVLFIKTSSVTNEVIQKTIEGAKQSLGMYNNNKFYPHVVVSSSYLPEEELYTIHHNSDCFVMPSYGESFCMPAILAMLFGKTPIITSDTGMNYYINNSNGWVVEGESVPCSTLDRPLLDLYTGNETWIKPNILSLKLAMQEAYSKSDLRKEKARKGINLRSTFTHEYVGKQIGSIL